MAQSDDTAELEPLLQPRLIRFMRDRPRLIDRGIRKEALDDLETIVAERRTTDSVANTVGRQVSSTLQDVTGRLARTETKKQLDKANQKQLKRL